MNPQIQKLTDEFADNLSTMIDREVDRRTNEVRDAVVNAMAFGTTTGKRNGGTSALVKQAMQHNEKVMRTAGKAMAGVVKVLAPKKKRPRTAAEHKASVLQGRYMGSMHSLSKASRNKVKSMRKKSGIVAAIKLAGKLARKK